MAPRGTHELEKRESYRAPRREREQVIQPILEYAWLPRMRLCFSLIV